MIALLLVANLAIPSDYAGDVLGDAIETIVDFQRLRFGAHYGGGVAFLYQTNMGEINPAFPMNDVGLQLGYTIPRGFELVASLTANKNYARLSNGFIAAIDPFLGFRWEAEGSISPFVSVLLGVSLFAFMSDDFGAAGPLPDMKLGFGVNLFEADGLSVDVELFATKITYYTIPSGNIGGYFGLDVRVNYCIY